MQTGTISFCGRNGINIKSESVKRRLLDVIDNGFQQKILKRHYESYNATTTPKRLRANAHMVALKSNGNPYFLLLTRINHVSTCVFIDKKIKHGYFLPRMIIEHLQFAEALFDGTLFDGEMIQPEKGSWIFMINDLIGYRGKHLASQNLTTRINRVYDLLDTEYTCSPHASFDLQVKRYLPLHRARELMEMEGALPYRSRGLVFKPLLLRHRDILYNFEEGLVKSTVVIKYGERNRFIAPDEVTRTFKVRDTREPDVYELLDLETNDVVGSPMINTLMISKKMNEMFSKAKLNDSFEVTCRFNEMFKRWEPLLN